jgi:iron-sulfur cluster repair protein YtfE (RIC family)
MTLRTLMQAGPAKANELFARLSETTDGAVKTRGKLFAELKAELELHTSLEEQHLFPILRRNPETKGLVAEAVKDNKELRAKLVELDALPKDDETFYERLKELQKSFRQHARDEKRELLPAVQRALSDEQVQGIVEKIEASVAEAKQDELEERRAKARQEREQQEAAEHLQEEASRLVRGAAETIASTATKAQASGLRIVDNARAGAERVGRQVHDVADTYVGAVRTIVPDTRAVTSLPVAAIGALTEIRSTWMNWMAQMTGAGARMSQELLCQAAEQQRQFAADAIQSWLDHNGHIVRITMNVAQRAFAASPMAQAANIGDRPSGR